MKTLRVLSPIEPGELCWVKVDGEWWLVRAERRDMCSECCLFDTGCRFPCTSGGGTDYQFSRVHPIPMPATVRDLTESGVYSSSIGVCWAEVDGNVFSVTRIGPPEE